MKDDTPSTPPHSILPLGQKDARPSDRIKSLIHLDSEIGQISDCLTYIANRAKTISINSSALSEQVDGDVKTILNGLTASAKNISSEAINVRFAVEAARSLISAHLDDSISRSQE